ncbi:MAG: hypothetical protein ACRD0A_11560 [Acidimicrobiales bacterium]
MKKSPRTSKERVLRGTLDGPSRTIEVEPVTQPTPAPSPPAAPPEREPERTPAKTRRG